MLRWAHQNDRGNNIQELYENFIEFVNSQMKYNAPKDNSEGNSFFFCCGYSNHRVS